MIENQIIEIGKKLKLDNSITEKTRPDTNSNLGNNPRGINNLNSILKKMDGETGVQYMEMPRMETAKINTNNMIKELNSNEEDNKKNKLALNTNINKGSKKNIDLYFLPQRLDVNGNPIIKGGKQKVTFIDKVTQKTLYEYIDIESYKEYNKMLIQANKSSSNNKFNSCCVII